MSHHSGRLCLISDSLGENKLQPGVKSPIPQHHLFPLSKWETKSSLYISNTARKLRNPSTECPLCRASRQPSGQGRKLSVDALNCNIGKIQGIIPNRAARKSCVFVHVWLGWIGGFQMKGKEVNYNHRLFQESDIDDSHISIILCNPSWWSLLSHLYTSVVPSHFFLERV